jgi:hypothetical protein
MKDMQRNCETIIKIVLLSMLFILPFSYGEITTEWTIFFSVSVAGCLFLLLKRIKSVNSKVLGVIFSILLMLIFDFTEKASFVHQFNIPVGLARRIPLSTVLLAVGVLALLVKALTTGKIKMINHPFVRNFLFACVFLVILMALFYPFLYRHYQMHPEPDIQLLNKMIKYLMILLLVMDDLSDEKNFRRMNLGFIFSISLTVILSIVL